MKKLTTTTISILVALVLILGVGAYYFFGHGLLSRTPMLYNTMVPENIVQEYLHVMIPRNIESIDLTKKIMSDVDISIPEIRVLAARMVDNQEFEVGQMKTWYMDWYAVPAPISLHTPTLTQVTSTGDEVAKVWLQDMIAQYEFDVSEAKKVRTYIEAIQEKKSEGDENISIINSHPSIDTALLFTEALEEKRMAIIGEMKDMLARLK